MSYKAFEFSLKTAYVFAENPVEALKEQLLKHQPKKPFVLCLDFMTHIPTEAFEGTNIPYDTFFNGNYASYVNISGNFIA